MAGHPPASCTAVARTFLLGQGTDGRRVSVRSMAPTPGRTEEDRERLRCVRLIWSD